MKKTAKILFLVILLGIISSLYAGEFSPREIIIKSDAPLRVRGKSTGVHELDQFLSSKSVKEIRKVTIPNMNYYVVYLNSEISRAEIENLRFDGIDYIQVNNLNQFYVTPNDSHFYSQELTTIGLQDAWDIERGNENITVAVIDSGILRDHPDLQGRSRLNYGEDADGDGFVMDPITGEYDPDDINGIDDDGNGFVDDICGWDFSDAPELEEIALGDYFEQDNDPTDENFHGTHVSGIICANTNNREGVAGINWNSKILPIRAGFRTLEGTGYLQDDDAAAAIIYAVNSGAHVINLSWGDAEYSPIIADACEYAYELGSIVVASAGNTPGPVLSYPARLSNVISVGSIGRDNDLSSFSTYGPDLDLVAPGEIILSTYSDGTRFTYDNQSGTSMAAPHVAGCISLLLSRNASMSYEEVRSKLLSSCDDLGDSGKDDTFGYGRVNALKLLTDEATPDLKLFSPNDFAGYSSDFPIIGTVATENFLYYTLMYSIEDVPTQLDWKDIITHNNTPTEFTEEVFNDTLAVFEFLEELPDNDYRLRLRVTNRDYNSYDIIRSFRLDRTAPILNPESVFLYPRYDAENMNYFLQALYSEKVVLNVVCRDSNTDITYSAMSTYPDELQTVKLPNDMPESLYLFEITATNSCGISSTNQYMSLVNYNSASINGWNRKEIGEGIVAIPKAIDYNGNGLPEVVGMHLIENSYNDVNIYEIGDSLTIQHSFNTQFWPYDLGNANESGIEVIGLNLDTMYLHETFGSATYPLNSPSWTESGSAGGYFKDIDLDGIDELFILKNDSSERIWDIKKYENDTYETVQRLRNNSQTDQRNSFVPNIAVGRLDFDNRVDILTADTEGDIMIYEYTESETSITPAWSFKFAVANTYYMETGDFTGDGTQEFVVAGYNDDPYNSNNNFWYVEMFDSIGDNQYEPVSRVMFDRKQSKNSIKVADVDGDGNVELILGFSPDLYIVDYLNDELTPIWHGECSWTYRIVPIISDESVSLLVNDTDSDENIVSVLYTRDDQYVENIPVPQNFRASLIAGDTAKLSWKQVFGADSYNVYRVGPDGEWTIPVTDNEYTDSGLVYGDEYTYYVTAIDNSQSPTESHSTAHKSIIPDLEPVIEEIKMTGLNQVMLTFDKKLSSDAYNIGFYMVDNNIGRPHSVNILNDRKRLLLRFSKYFEANNDYTLTISNLKSAMGVPINMVLPFSYIEDMEQPFVESVEIVSDKVVRISFNEELQETDILDIHNYQFTPPVNDVDNKIASIQYITNNQEKVAEITLEKKLVYSMEAYFIKLTNMRDLAGNYILNSRNLASFILEAEDIKVYPNPVYLETSDGNPVVNFIALPDNKKGNIYIYDTAGDLIFEKELKDQTRFNWDLKNHKGKRVSSGIYFYIIRMGDYHKKGKIGVIN